VNSYSPEYGTFIGRLQSPPPPLSSSGSGSQQQQQLTATTGIAGGGQISGLVYAVNESTIQIVNFTFDGLMPGMQYTIQCTYNVVFLILFKLSKMDSLC
jgi:hypothetical protein